MSEDPRASTAVSGVGGDLPDESPGANFQVFVDMQNLYNKLKLLNYDDEYVLKWRMKPISKIHFAIQTNAGDQLHSFIALASWLFQKAGFKYDKPSEDDDQSVLLQNIIGQFRKMGYEISFGANKLRSGSGESVIYILNRLADEAMKKANFTWRQPEKPEELPDDDQPKDEENEIDVNKIDEEMFNKDADNDEYEEDEPVLNMEALTKLGLRSGVEPEVRPELIMESTTDATEWKLEVERVLPQLKVTFKAENKVLTNIDFILNLCDYCQYFIFNFEDWRARQEQRLQHKNQIQTSLKDAELMLTRFHSDITKSLEKIITREQYINTNMQEYFQDFHHQQDILTQAKLHYRQCSSGITEKSQELQNLMSDLSRIREEMEETGQNVTDGGPLVKIKKAIEDINKDIVRVDVRIAVLEHTLMQSKVREKEEYNDEKQDNLLNAPDFETI
ncbi:unnamed protein product [Didymodactylos carnosus]|uniref:Intraflagellar transport protein 57 homolog n=1 Tax=Didymodactylos carnosus TaxID=1234261 RepID=A0A813UZJ1_9BILA|nr:unnamed protein product [Didymodactylos carnosus]CAF0833010.1 unnamed protein product [Didymodactylos carnosus]CAF3593418.1 unnamed protein product [Didymodactylos carnosus]CAF3620081.1 unnamed protein product [Didymodactylos carnosus]